MAIKTENKGGLIISLSKLLSCEDIVYKGSIFAA